MFIKICGLRHPQEIHTAVEAGAHAIGLVLAHSPRQVSPAQAAALLQAIPTGVLRVAVVREPTAQDLSLVEHLPFDLLQADATWHGPCAKPLLPAFPDGPDLLQRVAAWRAQHAHTMVLVDGPRGGGRGEPANWRRIQQLPDRVILAGGLHPENVALAIRTATPWGVDVSSGVEKSKGVKDLERIKRFVEVSLTSFRKTSTIR